jgi:hypothetical protein
MSNSAPESPWKSWSSGLVIGLMLYAYVNCRPSRNNSPEPYQSPAVATQHYWNHAIVLCSIASESIYANPNELWGHQRAPHIHNLNLIISELEKTSMVAVDPEAISRVQELIILLRAKRSWIEKSQNADFFRQLAEAIQDHNQGTPFRGLMNLYQQADDCENAMQIWASNSITTRAALSAQYRVNFPSLHCVLDRDRMKGIGDRVRERGDRFIPADEYPSIVEENP